MAHEREAEDEQLSSIMAKIQAHKSDRIMQRLLNFSLTVTGSAGYGVTTTLRRTQQPQNLKLTPDITRTFHQDLVATTFFWEPDYVAYGDVARIYITCRNLAY